MAGIEVARHTGDDVDPTHAQRLGIEHALHERGQAFDQTSLDELEKLWQEAKKK